MFEDKLTKAERMRLEALSQANVQSQLVLLQRPTQEDIFKLAEEIEKWLKRANLQEVKNGCP